MRAIVVRFAAITTLVVLPLTACGSGSSTSNSTSTSSSTASSGSGASELKVHAKDTLKFDKGSYEAKAGAIAIEYINDGSLPHTLLIDGHPDFKKLSVGSKDSGTANLTAGTYTIYCDVAGHRGAGMEAKLVVS